MTNFKKLYIILGIKSSVFNYTSSTPVYSKITFILEMMIFKTNELNSSKNPFSSEMIMKTYTLSCYIKP